MQHLVFWEYNDAVRRELDLVEKYWPDRGIFQGAATAYLRYCERRPREWVRFELPLWEEVLGRMELEKFRILDIGAGGGKMESLCFAHGVGEKRMVALEPNQILSENLHRKFPEIRCIQNKLENLKALNIGTFNLVLANMVVSELTSKQFELLVNGAKGKLKNRGYFAYTSPDPRRKAVKHRINYENNVGVAEEIAPWGGLVRYYHRSIEYQLGILKKAGFDKVKVLLGGFDVSKHTHEGPKRMLVVTGDFEYKPGFMEEIEII